MHKKIIGMSSKNKIITAIDIGTTKVVAIVGKVTSNGELQILGLEKTASTGVVKGVIQDINLTIEAIRTVVEKLQKDTNITIDKAYVGIAGQHIRILKDRQFKYLTDSETVTQEDINAILKESFRAPIQVGEQILHVIPQEYVVDKEKGISNPLGMAGRRLDGLFHIIIGRAASAKNIINCVNTVNIEIKELILEPIASSLAVLTPEEKEAGVVLVDIGGGTTDLAIYLDGVLRHTAVIPFGGNVITKDIKEGCHLLMKHAELLKVQFGEAIERLITENNVVRVQQKGGWAPKKIATKTIATIIQCRMEEILTHVKFQIDSTPYGGKVGAGIVLTGGGALLKNLDILTKEIIGLDVRIGRPNDSSIIKIDESINTPTYATSIGLLLQGLRESQNSLNNTATKQSNKNGNSKSSWNITTQVKSFLGNIFTNE